MGYEIKLIIGIKKPDFFLEIARIDLSKIGGGPLHKLIKFAKGKSDHLDFEEFKFLNDVRGSHLGVSPEMSELFGIGGEYDFVSIYDGNEKIDEDLYGEPLAAVPVLQILGAINEELKSEPYRRFSLAKKMLEELSSSEWEDVYVIPFGH